MKVLSGGAGYWTVAFGIAFAVSMAHKSLKSDDTCDPVGTDSCACAGLALLTPVAPSPETYALKPQGKWERIFDGKTLNGWSPKIRGYDYGDNFADTFRVKDGTIQVNYDGYGGKFEGRFGHLFYKTKLKSYVLRFEYRFTGDQIADGPGWALRNSGAMLICQDPASMRKDQDFPVSIEGQLLGGTGQGDRPTGNVCTPGTNIVLGGKLWTQHCTNSVSKTYNGDQWVTAEFEVHAGGKIIHRINGEKVLEYEGAQLDPSDADGKTLIDAAKGEKTLTDGWISLQSESHPCEFRNIELMEIKEKGLDSFLGPGPFGERIHDRQTSDLESVLHVLGIDRLALGRYRGTENEGVQSRKAMERHKVHRFKDRIGPWLDNFEIFKALCKPLGDFGRLL